jgi:hypothetical protein
MHPFRPSISKRPLMRQPSPSAALKQKPGPAPTPFASPERAALAHAIAGAASADERMVALTKAVATAEGEVRAARAAARPANGVQNRRRSLFHLPRSPHPERIGAIVAPMTASLPSSQPDRAVLAGTVERVTFQRRERVLRAAHQGTRTSWSRYHRRPRGDERQAIPPVLRRHARRFQIVRRPAPRGIVTTHIHDKLLQAHLRRGLNRVPRTE